MAGAAGAEPERHCHAGASVHFWPRSDEIAARALELLQPGITGTGVQP